MFDREAHLDLLADEVVGKIGSLLGEAIREAVTDAEALRICKIEPVSGANGVSAYDKKSLQYIDGLLDQIPRHIDARWSRFRSTEQRLLSATAAIYDEEEGDFEG